MTIWSQKGGSYYDRAASVSAQQSPFCWCFCLALLRNTPAKPAVNFSFHNKTKRIVKIPGKRNEIPEGTTCVHARAQHN